MNSTSQDSVKAVLRCGIIAAAAACAMYGQTQVNLATQSRDVDFSNAPATRPVKTGTALPATCLTGDLFFKTNAPQGQNLYGCPAVNTWALLIGETPASFYQTVETNATALAQRPAVNFSSAFSVTDDSASSLTDVDLAAVNSNVGTFGSASQVPVITVNAYGLITGVSTAPVSGSGSAAVWGAITGTLSAQTDLETVLSGKQAIGNYVTALTGDVTASGPGSAAATLASVNSASGQCGDATHVCQVTTDPKGRVTVQTPVAISAGGTGTVTHTAGALTSGQLIVGNGSGDISTGDLTGDITTSGSTAATLATVNSASGQCGDATHVCQVTTDPKGRVTVQTPVAITGGSGSAAVWGAITGTLSAQTDLETALSGKQAIGNYLTALTGDGTASGPGSAALTLATVNSASGQCGDATHVCQVTTDPKGRVTAQAPVAITGGSGSAAVWGAITGTLSAQTDLETVLSGKQAIGNYVTALTGDVTASGPGSAAATLASVNSASGQCGDATHVCQVTTDPKGRVTVQTPVAISAGGTGTVTHTAGALTSGQLIVGNGSGDISTGDLTGDITTSGSTAATLATVNSASGQCGDATHVCQVTTDPKGRVTVQTPVAITGGSGSATSIQGTAVSPTAPADLQVLQYQTASQSYVPATISGATGNWAAGTFANAPATCTPGVGVYLYFATDQPAGQQEYQCSATNTWTQIVNIGPSGALAITNGSLDIVTSVVPRLPNTNTFTGSNTFSGPVFQVDGTTSDPGCTQASDIGKIWINTTSAANTAYEVCLSVSSAIQWVIK